MFICLLIAKCISARQLIHDEQPRCGVCTYVRRLSCLGIPIKVTGYLTREWCDYKLYTVHVLHPPQSSKAIMRVHTPSIISCFSSPVPACDSCCEDCPTCPPPVKCPTCPSPVQCPTCPVCTGAPPSTSVIRPPGIYLQLSVNLIDYFSVPGIITFSSILLLVFVPQALSAM